MNSQKKIALRLNLHINKKLNPEIESGRLYFYLFLPKYELEGVVKSMQGQKS